MSEPAHTPAERTALRRQTLTGRRIPAGQQDALDQEEIPVAHRFAAVCAVSRAAWLFAGNPIEPLRRDIVTRVRRTP